ncbi:MAG TPA: hypothetical protein VMF89_10725, partial [Polyangiales bacterium]|nr:hypothetical protein [Polyangiales bacterium]
MASKQGIARKLGWLLACVCIAGAGCDDDSAADGAHGHDDDGHSHAGAHSHDEGGAHSHDEVIGNLTGTMCPEGGGTLTYENFGKKFMEDYCLTCHSVDSKDRKMAPADHNFDTLVDV